MAKNFDDRDEPKPEPGFRVESDPELYDEYDDYDFGFDFDFGEQEVY